MKKRLRFLERASWAVGVVLLCVWAGYRVHGEVGRRSGLESFAQARLAAAEWASSVGPDLSQWSEGRIEAYHESLVHDIGVPLAVIRIPGIDLEVPVYDGTDELTLNRAVGRIDGTAWPGEPGNLGIAGHRDGFFRGLKDVGDGDAIDLVTLDGIERYVVESTTIVTPEDVHVLAPTDESVLTLVTCYPFYFVGSAPERYIVRAVKPELTSETHSPTMSPPIAMRR